jgi:hypothetical protein
MLINGFESKIDSLEELQLLRYGYGCGCHDGIKSIGGWIDG